MKRNCFAADAEPCDNFAPSARRAATASTAGSAGPCRARENELPRVNSADSDCTTLRHFSGAQAVPQARAGGAISAPGKAHSGSGSFHSTYTSQHSTAGTAAQSMASVFEATPNRPQQVATAAIHCTPTPAASWQFELSQANHCLQRLPMPGGVAFCPVDPSCAMLPLLIVYQVSPAAVALGAAYFQRLLVGNEELNNCALEAGFFSLVDRGGIKEAVMHARSGYGHLLSIYCTCVYLGIKVTEGPRYARQLSSMLAHVLGQHVTTEQASDMEVRCLCRLDWRLGPYCCGEHARA